MSRKGRSISSRQQRRQFIEYLRTVGEGPECITWPWSHSPRYASTVDETGHQVSVHRWVYEQIKGPLNGLEACHTCDTPPCVRPSHLFAASHGENMRDAYRKGRKHATHHAPPGEAHWNARLSEAQVRAIRRLCVEGVSQTVIAHSFGIARTTVTRIHTRTLWKHLPEEP